ncbi:MAG: endonuclease/exonuclease/phosphatase [Blastocatellia bacterium]|nr:endonuclease/exonuclease/phosphatase [Blastocatellia bacterium]
MFNELFLAFWNVENLFDTETAERPGKIKQMIEKDIVGWDTAMLAVKLKQLSKVISSMNSGKGPDILGLCEIENRNVLVKLTEQIRKDIGRSYSIAHADTSDNRGIDVAFIYDSTIATASEMFQHWVVKRYPTRELFQVNFIIDKKTLVLIGNHWPSRTSGQYESEPYRMMAGETLSYWIEQIQVKLGDDVGIIVMGDFNDEPFNRSITEYALATNNSQSVLNQQDLLLNLMWPILASGLGSHVYNGRWNLLDQIMVNRAVVNRASGWRLSAAPRIEATKIMSRSDGVGPRRFGFKPKERDKDGFSDHYPVSITLKK